ncbi:MT-A70-domain-containing protein [Cucurbitaria berberidis CBS 394.84]|uniref:MT-A70-domain-containing protein n=1 Tax=Cucurbitaria berberidis CBS 394.84 TaxID=1168544 RepID=A0A9P4L4A4_9PLEO|nr:MT-A70-domain-containing protein [Cucurbitaria berberidis CBS 394.84]KAF1840683.1 MT-A70-domain-containing protein [Cucurbitaria berberidis CBS 394.84]
MAYADPSAARSTPWPAVIYQNAERDIILIDIPTSIAAAQGRSDILLSTPPLEVPIEPKEEYRPKASRMRMTQTPDFAQHEEYKALIEQALAEIRTHVSSPWCAPRKFLAQAPHRRYEDLAVDHPEKELESRLREWAAWRESKGDNTAFDLQKMMASLGATSEYEAMAADAVTQTWMVSYRPAREAMNGAQAAETVAHAQSEPWTSTFHNPEDLSLELAISRQAQLGQEYRFTIPPRSTLFLSDSTHSDAFRTSFRQLTDEYTLPRHFDLVLLDPPWPNRSAKRKGAYEQCGGVPYLKKMLLRMDIDSYLEHNALVGIWITNKKSLREHVLGPGGLFETWNVGLIEEWIWIKTTTKGEPMFDIDDPMRKPYEVMLLGRAAPSNWTTMQHSPSVKRRVIVAVPDIHSRKPCLKELLEPYMRDPKDYSALEIFSRYLVAGWTSWGNEALKYNWDKYWAANVLGQSASEQTLPIRSI